MAVVFLAIWLFRLTLIDKGLMYWWDERMHWFSLRMLSDVASGNWGDFFQTPFHPKIQGRPLWIILNMIPAGGQVGLFLISGIKTETPTSLYWVGIYNVMLSMVVVWLFWLIARKVLINSTSAVTATIIYALLANSTVNVRHLYPIYPALIFYLGAMLICLKADLKKLKWVLIAGMLSALGQLTYASYFLFPVFGIIALIYRRGGFKQIASFCLGYTLPILAFELWARGMGTSLYASIAREPGLNPSLMEAWLFLPRYLIEAEGKIGLVLVILSPLPLLMAVRLKRINLAMGLGIASIVAYGLFGITTLFHHRIYARVIHIYLLFLILGIVGSMELINQRRWWILGLGMVAIISFYEWAGEFSKLVYPSDVRFKICRSYYICPEGIVEVNENSLQPIQPLPDKTRVVLVNTPYFAPIYETSYTFSPPPNLDLVASWPHPLNFIPYQLEGYSPQERLWLRQQDYTMRVYR